VAAVARPTPIRKDVPTLSKFVPEFEADVVSNNKPSEVDSKRAILRAHLIPAFGPQRLDDIGERRIEAYNAKKLEAKLSKKTVNNHLTVLRRLLALARRFNLIERVPELMWLKAPWPELDFLSFEEADRLVAGADGECHAMILLGLRSGLRQGELIGLRWEDVDLFAGKLLVRQAITRGVVGTPKSGKPREVPLSDQALSSLKRQQHLRRRVSWSSATWVASRWIRVSASGRSGGRASGQGCAGSAGAPSGTPSPATSPCVARRSRPFRSFWATRRSP
jgi:integrase